MWLMNWAVAVFEASHMKTQPFRRSSVLQSLSSPSTTSLSCTPVTDCDKKEPIIIYSRVLTGPALPICQAAVLGPCDSQFQHCQSSRRSNLSSLFQADIFLNINNRFFFFFLSVTVIYHLLRCAKRLFSSTTDLKKKMK